MIPTKQIAKIVVPVALLNFFVAYGIKSLFDDIVHYKQETVSFEQKVEDPTRSLFKTPITTYDRVTNQVYPNILEEIRVDRGGDGTIDDTIVFFTRKSDVILSENAIGIYNGWPASGLLGNQRELIRLPVDIQTNDKYRGSAKQVLGKRGYDVHSIEGFNFFKPTRPIKKLF